LLKLESGARVLYNEVADVEDLERGGREVCSQREGFNNGIYKGGYTR
jgi:hypothetical protein